MPKITKQRGAFGTHRDSEAIQSRAVETTAEGMLLAKAIREERDLRNPAASGRYRKPSAIHKDPPKDRRRGYHGSKTTVWQTTGNWSLMSKLRRDEITIPELLEQTERGRYHVLDPLKRKGMVVMTFSDIETASTLSLYLGFNLVDTGED